MDDVHKYDFKQLASKYPEFAPFVFQSKYGFSIDWKDPIALRHLTKAILKEEYNIDWDLPENQLCPPVPQRASYIEWLQELLGRDVVTAKGVDIGTGFSCIYPLIGSRKAGWSFLATDIDEAAVAHATHLVRRNFLEDKIEVRLATPSCILTGVLRDDERFDFCMCNPPFFSSLDDAALNPHKGMRRAGTTKELVCPGGELAFISQIITDSAHLRDRITWYSSMIGRKHNLTRLLALLKDLQVACIRSTEFIHGHTTRWALAWSFTNHPSPLDNSQVPSRGWKKRKRQDGPASSGSRNGTGKPRPAARVSKSFDAFTRMEPLRLLDAVRDALVALGADVRVDRQQFRIEGCLPNSPSTASSHDHTHPLPPPSLPTAPHAASAFSPQSASNGTTSTAGVTTTPPDSESDSEIAGPSSNAPAPEPSRSSPHHPAPLTPADLLTLTDRVAPEPSSACATKPTPLPIPTAGEQGTSVQGHRTAGDLHTAPQRPEPANPAASALPPTYAAPPLFDLVVEVLQRAPRTFAVQVTGSRVADHDAFLRTFYRLKDTLLACTAC